MHSYLMNFSRMTKQVFWLVLDTLLVPISLYLAFGLRLGTVSPFSYMSQSWPLFPLLALVGAMICVVMQLHRIKLHALERHAVLRIGAVSLLLTVSAMVLSYLLGTWAPRSVPLIMGGTFFCGALGLRMLILGILTLMEAGSSDKKPVAIYGAGAAGMQLASALRQSSELSPKFFIDDSPALRGLIISGLRVQAPEMLEALVASGKITQVLVAMPSISRAPRCSAEASVSLGL
jgi:FlaA1/EpsC-like NDP-sugar epimerase